VPVLVLASSSPRRRELLAALGLEFAVEPADVDESPRPGEQPVAYVRRLSVDKARAVVGSCGPGAGVVAAATTVDLHGRILGKPATAEEARSMLLALSGATHEVHTGVTVARDTTVVTGVESTAVTFTEVTPDLAEWYIATGEPFDKAGGYAIQGAGALLVERVEGSVSNVVGLPLTLLAGLMVDVGLRLVSAPVT
jgi:septum formation protein